MKADIAKEFVGDLLRSQQDEIVRGAFRALLTLDEAATNTVFKEMADTCRARFLRMVDFPADLDLDGFIERMGRAAPPAPQISRDGDTIIWREFRDGNCMCPLVRRGTLDLHPKLCVCSTEWTRGLVETFHGGPVEAELLESVATGSRDCVFRLTLGPVASHAP